MIFARYHTILFIGGTILLVGYALFEVTASGIIVTERPPNIIFSDEVSIQADENFSKMITIETNLMVLIDLQSTPTDNLIELQIKDDANSSILDLEYKKKLVASFSTESTQLYNISISNLGKVPALIKIEIKDVPYLQEKGSFGLDYLVWIKTGLIMMVGGISGLGFGTWIYFHDRKKSITSN